MKPITKNLYQFSTYIAEMDFTIHQYLLASSPSILFSTGTMQKAKEISPTIKEILKNKPLDYIFVSHIESDECGGLSIFLNAYPEVKVICSALGARELYGYGYEGALIIGDTTHKLIDGKLSLQFFDYPSEIHLQNGLLCLEENTNAFYSADLMLRFGDGCEQELPLNWSKEIGNISATQIPDEQKLSDLKKCLAAISPSFVAVGHGYCLTDADCEK